MNLLAPKTPVRRAWSRGSWAVVNATASVAVREAFAGTGGLPTRVIETSLFAGGQIGVVTVEGPDRNPNTNDLMAELYALLARERELSDVLLRDNGTTTFEDVGQGCGSLTMTMSDGRLSLFAASMAEYLLAKQRDGLPCGTGELLVGKLSADDLGLEWRTHTIPSVTAPLIHAPDDYRVFLTDGLFTLAMVLGLKSDVWFSGPVGVLSAVDVVDWMAIAVAGAHILVFTFIVRRDWVRTAADAYALQLLASCDMLESRKQR